MISKTDIAKCGNCDYWAGNREPCFDKHSTPKNNIIDAQGICNSIHSQFTDELRKQQRTCKHFSKWTELL